MVLTFFGFCHAFLPQIREESRYRRINSKLNLTAKRGKKAKITYSYAFKVDRLQIFLVAKKYISWLIVVVLLICLKVWGGLRDKQKSVRAWQDQKGKGQLGE